MAFRQDTRYEIKSCFRIVVRSLIMDKQALVPNAISGGGRVGKRTPRLRVLQHAILHQPHPAIIKARKILNGRRYISACACKQVKRERERGSYPSFPVLHIRTSASAHASPRESLAGATTNNVDVAHVYHQARVNPLLLTSAQSSQVEHLTQRLHHDDSTPTTSAGGHPRPRIRRTSPR
jgi:hypothetical protein